MQNKSIVQKRQEPLIEEYLENPTKAWIIDEAIIEGKNLDDPFHTSVSINDELKVEFPIGVHRAVGGNHDAPNPGDLFCASLASCFESTLRMIANRLNIELIKTSVKANAMVDVRGTLMIDRTVPVAFQQMKLSVDLKVMADTMDEKISKLLMATEKCCIIFQTIKKGIPIEIETKIN